MFPLLWVGGAWASVFFGVDGMASIPLTEDWAVPGALWGGYAGATGPHWGFDGHLAWGGARSEFRYVVHSARASGLYSFFPDARVDLVVLAGFGYRWLTPAGDIASARARSVGFVVDPMILVYGEAGAAIRARIWGPVYVRGDVRPWMGDASEGGRRTPFFGIDAVVGVEVRPDLRTDRDGDGFKNRFDGCPDVAEDVDSVLDRDGCPEDDVDRDGLGDAVDRCPTRRETVNGQADDDGCPDFTPVARAAVPEPARALSGRLDGVEFAFDSAEILPASDAALTHAVEILQAHPTLHVLIRGHTDSVAEEGYNLGLSIDRAEAVRAWFITHGIAPERLAADGFGETSPVDTNDTEAGRARNRRVELIIVAG